MNAYHTHTHTHPVLENLDPQDARGTVRRGAAQLALTTRCGAASAAARFLSSGVMDLPVASSAINYDNQQLSVQAIARFY